MTEKKALEKLQQINEKYEYDEEMAHVEADKLLCEVLTSLGYEQLVKMFDSMVKWYA